MSFRTAVECVVIVAAASVACAADYRQRVEDVQCQAADATYQADQLEPFLPSPEYEYYRGLAIHLAHDARYYADSATMWANNADGWWRDYSRLMVAKATRQGYSITELNEAKAMYDKAVAKCYECCDNAAYNSRVSLMQTAHCRRLLPQ
jgi:hypothetical protein